MTDKPYEADTFRALWQSMPTETVSISAEEMRQRAATFQKRVRRRNMREYIACVFVIIVFGWYSTFPSKTILWPIANGMIILATVYVGYMLHRKGKAAATPQGGSVLSMVEFHRRELVRQRDALRSIWRWYLAPFLPGLALFFVAMWIGKGAYSAKPVVFATSMAVTSLVCALVFAAILLLNLLGAARLQRMIDDLDRYKEKP